MDLPRLLPCRVGEGDLLDTPPHLAEALRLAEAKGHLAVREILEDVGEETELPALEVAYRDRGPEGRPFEGMEAHVGSGMHAAGEAVDPNHVAIDRAHPGPRPGREVSIGELDPARRGRAAEELAGRAGRRV